MALSPLSAGLHVAATPIGNLGDVSDRLRAALAAADYVLCEDTRVTGRLLMAMGIDASLQPYHDHNGEHVRPRLLADLEAGKTLVLVSDAGTPLIADPGYKLVREARERGIGVFAIPGPSALTAALSIAGVPTNAFTFLGFLPPKTHARRARWDSLAGRDETLVAYETGPRLAACLDDLATSWGGDTKVVIARELTKRHEEVVEGDAAALAERYTDAPPKGEIVLIVPPRPVPALTEDDIDALMREALKTHRLKDAAAEVAAKTGRKRRDLYQAWLTKDA